MEDGVVLGVCLRRAGKNRIPTALRAYETIRYVSVTHKSSFHFKANILRRYDRVGKVQKTGETTRDMWHKADWDKVCFCRPENS